MSLTLIIERLFSLQTKNIAPNQLLQEVFLITQHGLPNDGVIARLELSSVLGKVLAQGLRSLQKNPQSTSLDLHTHMEGVGKWEARELEKYLTAIATIASAAPLLGLFGTVVGMIEIFGSQSLEGGVTGGNPAQLAHGISVALYNTAFGLIVAIPSLIFWRYFRSRVDDYVLVMELASEQLIRHLMRQK